MKKIVKINLGMILLIGIFFLTLVSAAYSRSNPNYGTFDSYVKIGEPSFKQGCEAGQDFILQIAPSGCTPAVVRSDLLEEQNVPVFCQIAATKINPLVDVNAIEGITFSGKYPKEISGVGFYPAKAALGVQGDVNNPVLNNIGYAVIVLKKTKNESSMPNFVEGDLTARLKYDLQNAFGIGKATYYIPQLNDNEWRERKNQYSFWNGNGILKAEEITTNDAVVSIYNDIDRIASVRLKNGQISDNIFMPGFDCRTSLKLKLDGLESSDTMARFEINGEVFQVKKGEYFLENRCQVKNLEKSGLNQKVTLYCKEDESSGFWGGKEFSLEIKSKIKLEVDGEDSMKGDCVKSGGGCETGDVLYRLDSQGEKFVYLGYFGQDSEGVQFIVPVVSTEKTKESFLKSSFYKTLPQTINSYIYTTRNIVGDATKALGLSFLGGISMTIDNKFVSGSYPVGLINLEGKENLNPSLKASKIVFNEVSVKPSQTFSRDFNIPKIKFTGFANAINTELTGEAKTNYENAIMDYDAVIKDYKDEKHSEGENKTIIYGEWTLYEKIILAKELNQKKDISNLCKQFREDYPESTIYKNLFGESVGICNDLTKLSSSESSSISVMISNKARTISFAGIVEPGFDDYGAEVYFSGKNNKGQGGVRLVKGAKLQLVDNDFVELVNVGEDYATFRFNVKETTSQALSSSVRFTGRDTKIKLNDYVTHVGENDYKFGVTQINFKKLAKVSISPSIDNVATSTNFSFKIGIEKRAIKLSPEKTREKIESLNKTIADWEKKSEALGNVVKGLKGACLTTGAFMTVKNFFSNLDGSAIARQKVMRENGGWYEYCNKQFSAGKFSSVEECLINEENSKKIENDVKKVEELMATQNEQLKLAQKDCVSEKKFLTETVYDTDCFKKNFMSDRWKDSLKTRLTSQFGDKINVNGKDVPVDNFVNGLNHTHISVEELRDLDLYASSGKGLSVSEPNLKKIIGTIEANTKEEVLAKSFSERTGFSEVHITSFEKQQNKLTFTNDVLWSSVRSKFSDPNIINEDARVQNYINPLNGEEYITVLNKDNVVTKTYKITSKNSEGKSVLEEYKGSDKDKSYEGNPLKLIYKKLERKSYENEFKSSSGSTAPLVRYYETEPYKGVPATTPFDLKSGWYASIKQTIPIGKGIASVDASGRVSSFYLCNVGENKREESRGGDDICEMINLGTGQPYNQFPGIGDTSYTSKLVKVAIEAVSDAQKQYKSGVSEVFIRDLSGKKNKIKVGNPAVDIPDMQCQDFMSPKDCQILFNVCDPVICPPSRCDLGGTYHVQDVIQSGIVGSIALCLPNWNKGIYVPVCLTGIKAGIDGLLSVYKSYGNCLQESLKSGETVGVCDEIHSIYLCESLWKQGLPVANLIVPKIMETALGQNVKGGGEYLGVASAWDTASKSVDYFTNYYAQNSFSAFKARSTEEAGGELCRNFASGVFPAGGNVLDRLTDPDSPPQFYGRFDEIPFTTATVPPVSQYKVFYHIYAGNDSRAYYQVYLKGSLGSSYYQDTSSSRIVDAGYIARGGYVSQTKDFTAPAGYKQLCIRVNNQEVCGFQQSSTSYAVNYITDKYLQEQALGKVTSEGECISGSASTYSLLNPNLQSAGESLINPEIYNRGIIRICASDNPGKGTDASYNSEKSRWIEVGYCGDKKIKCWLDRKSVENVIKAKDIENQTLSELEQKQKEILKNQLGYESDSGVNQKIEEIRKIVKDNPSKAISDINLIVGKTFLNSQKARLFFLRGQSYGELAKRGYSEIRDKGKITEPEFDIPKRDKEKEEDKKEESSAEEVKVVPVNYFEGMGSFGIVTEPQFKKTLTSAKYSRCTDYSRLILTNSETYKVDPFLLMAIMIQESGCKKDADNGRSFGLMQIDSKTWCGNEKFGLPSDIEECRSNLLNDPALNIKISTAILKDNYNTYNKNDNLYEKQVKNFCKKEEYRQKYLSYSNGWERALRAYNGLGCTPPNADVNYTENVGKKYANLVLNYTKVKEGEDQTSA